MLQPQVLYRVHHTFICRKEYTSNFYSIYLDGFLLCSDIICQLAQATELSFFPQKRKEKRALLLTPSAQATIRNLNSPGIWSDFRPRLGGKLLWNQTKFELLRISSEIWSSNLQQKVRRPREAAHESQPNPWSLGDGIWTTFALFVLLTDDKPIRRPTCQIKFSANPNE